MPYTLTDDEIRELWDRYGAGETAASLARRFHKTSDQRGGGCCPAQGAPTPTWTRCSALTVVTSRSRQRGSSTRKPPGNTSQPSPAHPRVVVADPKDLLSPPWPQPSTATSSGTSTATDTPTPARTSRPILDQKGGIPAWSSRTAPSACPDSAATGSATAPRTAVYPSGRSSRWSIESPHGSVRAPSGASCVAAVGVGRVGLAAPSVQAPSVPTTRATRTNRAPAIAPSWSAGGSHGRP